MFYVLKDKSSRLYMIITWKYDERKNRISISLSTTEDLLHATLFKHKDEAINAYNHIMDDIKIGYLERTFITLDDLLPEEYMEYEECLQQSLKIMSINPYEREVDLKGE